MATKKESLPRSIVAALPAAFEIAKLLHEAEARLTQDLGPQLLEAESRGAMDMARAFVAFHRLNDKFKEFSKEFSAVYESVKVVMVPENLDEAGIRNAPLAEGYRVDTSLQLFASIRADMLPNALVYCRENGLPNLIAETINAKTLSSALSHEIKETSKEPPREIFNITYKSSSKVTALKSKTKSAVEIDDIGD